MRSTPKAAYRFSILLCAMGAFYLLVGVGPSPAADPDFVGVLALAVEDEGAQKLGLAGDSLQELKQLVRSRELGVLELQDELKTLEPAEQAERLAAYRRESEQQGLALLTEDQRHRLEQLRISTQGLISLSEPKIAEQLQISPEQQEQIKTLLAERSQALAAERDDSRRRTSEFEYERKLAQLLTPTQRAAWSVLAGDNSGATPDQTAANAAGSSPDAAASADPSPAGNMPATAPTESAPNPAAGTAEILSRGGPAVINRDPAPAVSPLAQVAPMQSQTARADRGAGAATTTATSGSSAQETARLRFGFRYAPWKDVLDWLAEEAGYSLYFVDLPEGTFNYSSDSKTYTPAQAIDLLNSVLLTKGFMLVKRERILMLINLENGVPPSWVPFVSAEELDERGEFELVSVLFTLDKFAPEEAEAEIRKLLGPQGAVVVLPQAKQILVTETAGRLKTIRRVVERVEGPEGGNGGFRAFPLQYITVDEAMTIIRELLGIPKDLNSTDTIKIAPDMVTKRLLVSAPPEVLKQIESYLKEIDKEAPPSAEVAVGETLQLEIHPVLGPDPNTVLQVLQTMMTGSAGVRLTVDPSTGSIVALARPTEHATIRATIKQMQTQAQKKIGVWTLAPTADASVVQLTIAQLMAGETEEEQKKAPKLSYDPTTQRLVAMGSDAQIAQIEQLLQQFQWDAENLEPIDPSQRSNVRLIPNLTGSAGRNAAELLEQYFPTLRRNRIRVVYPSQFTPGTSEPRDDIPLNLLDDLPLPGMSRPEPAAPASGVEPSQPDARRNGSQPAFRSVQQARNANASLAAAGRLPGLGGRKRVDQSNVSQDIAAEPKAAGESSMRREKVRLFPAVFQSQQPATTADAPARSDLPGDPASDVTIMVTPRGLVISSEDLDALDDAERLLSQLQEMGALQPEDFHVFYLKHTTAAAAAQTLDKVLGGGTIASEESAGGGGGLLGSIADSALGNMGGGLMRGFLGLEGDSGSSSLLGSSSVLIVPDSRLNALFISASATDLDLIERLLTYIDQEGTPETQIARKPRLIPVHHTSATEIEKVVRQVYSDKLISSGGSSGGSRQPSPEDLIRALRGGGSRGRGGSEEAEDVNKMALGVDERSNSLVVSAPQQLFEEVETLVGVLDQAASGGADQSSFIYNTKRTSPAAIQQALQAIAGDKVKIVTRTATPTAPSASSATASATQSSSQPSNSSGDSPDEIRERIQRFMQFRDMMQRGGGDSSGRGGSGGFGGFGPPGGGSPFGGGGGDRGSSRGGGSSRGSSGRGGR